MGKQILSSENANQKIIRIKASYIKTTDKSCCVRPVITAINFQTTKSSLVLFFLYEKGRSLNVEFFSEQRLPTTLKRPKLFNTVINIWRRYKASYRYISLLEFFFHPCKQSLAGGRNSWHAITTAVLKWLIIVVSRIGHLLDIFFTIILTSKKVHTRLGASRQANSVAPTISPGIVAILRSYM